MANPFDQFDETASAANPFDQFDEKTNPFNQFDSGDYSNEGHNRPSTIPSEIPGSRGPTPKYVEPQDPRFKDNLAGNALKYGLGGLEALGTVGSGMVAGLAALPESAIKSTYEAAKGKGFNFRKNAEEAAARMTYDPKSQTGQDIVEGLEPAMTGLQALGPTGFHLPVSTKALQMRMGIGEFGPAKPTLPSTKIGGIEELLAKKREAAAASEVPQGPRTPPDSTNPVVTVGSDGVAIPPNADVGTVLAKQRADDLMGRSINPEGQRELFADDPRQKLADQGPQNLGNEPIPPRGALSDARQVPLDFTPEQKLTGTPDGQILRGAPDSLEPAGMQAQAAAVEQARLAEQSKRMGNAQQMLIDDTQHVLPDSGEVYGAQYGTGDGVGRVDENGMPIRADRSIEAQQLENPLQRNLWGDELDPGLGQKLSLTQAIDLLPDSPFFDDVRQNALSRLNPTLNTSWNRQMRGQGGAVGRDLGASIRAAEQEAPIQWFTASPEGGRTASHSLETQASRPNAEGQRYGPGQYIAQSRDFSSVYGGKEGRMYTVDRPFDRPFDVTNPKNDKIYQSLVESTGSRTEANQALERAGYDAITFTSPRGDKLANIFKEKPLQDVGPAREKIREQTLALEEWEPGKVSSTAGSTYGRRQGGWVGGGKKTGNGLIDKIPGMLEKMKNFLPDGLTNEQFLATHANTADIDQNFVQKGFNYLTKGGDYMAQKTDNPLIKRVVDELKGADGRAKANIQKFVHEDYAAKLRTMSKDEFTETWGALKAMERDGAKLTSDELISAGYNQKQRDFIKTHQDIMDIMAPKAAKAMEDAGLGTFKPETAYVAAKATGQFRKVIYKKLDDGTLSPAGVIGGDTRGALNKQVQKYMEAHPDYQQGPEITAMGGKGRLADGFEDMLKFLGDNDPTVQEFMARTKELMQSDAANYRGAKTHGMAKKGVEGMAGNKPWEDAYTNAKEGFDAQVAYLNRMFEFSEKAASLKKIDPLLQEGNGLNMPNAKKYANDYRDMALGRNPTQVGRALDNLFDRFGDASGFGTAKISGFANDVKHVTNTKLLSLSPGFLLGNALDIMRNTPEMAMFLRNRGVKTSAFGLEHNFMAALDMAKEQAGGTLSPVIAGAIKFADENHVYASDLFERTNETRTGLGSAISAGLQKPAAILEHYTRKNAYLGYVRMMNDNGIKPAHGLYEAAAKLTDMAMNNYSTMEQPIGLQNLGGMSKYPYNLLAYKLNTLSRFAMLARDVKEYKSVAPVMTALAMQAAMGGVAGMIGYKEADYLVRKFTEAAGNPTSLTKLMLESKKSVKLPLLGDTNLSGAYFGGFGAAGGDMTNRLGTGAVLGDLSQPADMIMPGAGAIGTAAKSAYDLATDPSMFNVKKAVVDILPGGAMLDRKFFSKTREDGVELASSRSKQGKAMAIRDDADKAWKTLGMTGSNETKQKSLEFENQRVDKFYADKQKTAVEGMKESLFETGRVDRKYIDKFKAAQGDLNTLNKTIDNMVLEQNIDAPTANKIKLAARNSVPAARQMQRRFQ